jgi:pimeloyl-ACP methyl ester carboxylesterase
MGESPQRGKLIAKLVVFALCALSWNILIPVQSALSYDYPFTNQYVSTIVGTPAEFSADLPQKIPTRVASLKLFPDRKTADILWNLTELRYSYTSQDHEAPLIFLIAGTGASFHSAKMKVMQKAFFQAGYHVVSLSSSTHPNFIVAASSSGVPGHLSEDARDLYHVMQLIRNDLADELDVSNYSLAGYSLGAAQSAFVAQVDEQEQQFNFRKVLLINPPVNLYNSVEILDNMLDDNIPGGLDNFNAFYEKVTKAFAEVYSYGDDVEFNDQFLYRAYQYRKPKKDAPLKGIIGWDFRISSGNMAFTSDVLTRAGYVVSKDLSLGRHDHVTEYAKVLYRLSFRDYFNDIFIPHFQQQDASLNEADLIELTSLKHIEDYIRTSPKLGLIGNEDDFILQPGEMDYLKQLFGDRAVIFPYGGHCGNMGYPDNVAAMVEFIQSAEKN